MKNDITPDIQHLSLNDQFNVLLHRKIMHKTGSVKRRLKKYYKDKYDKTGIIPAPLLLVQQGIMDGRKCSGRPRTMTPDVQQRFVEMVKASCDHGNNDFLFISRRMRSISNYHKFLEEEFSKKISLQALRYFARQGNIKQYLEKSDYDEPYEKQYYFDQREVFGLIQMDGCNFHYFKIRNDIGEWQKPQVIEFFDTGSRYIFVLDAFFSESSLNSVDLFTQFLLSTSFPHKTIRIRPDNAGGFLNLKRPIHEINLKYSMPDGFFMKPDFARVRAPKHKAHLESSHRSLHYFEARIIKAFEKKIVRTEPGIIYKNGKIETISVTLLDIDLNDLRTHGIIETYQKQHNNSKHNFSKKSMTKSWIPREKFNNFMTEHQTFDFSINKVKQFMRYGFDKIKATVSTQRKIRFEKQDFYVAKGAERFSRYKSTKVIISKVEDKLLIFEDKSDGVIIGEAVCQKKYDVSASPKKSVIRKNEVELISEFLEKQGMLVDPKALINANLKGLTLNITKQIYQRHQERYENYSKRVNHSNAAIGKALFNAFLVDYDQYQRNIHVAPYATYKEKYSC